MNPLVNAIPAKYRRYVYALAFLASLAVAAWTAADGDWRVFVGSLLSALVTALAHANTDPAA